MPSEKEKAQAALQEMQDKVTKSLNFDKGKDEQMFIRKPSALDFDSVENLKKLILQNIKRPNSPSYTKYTKALVKQYLANPGNYREQIVGVSRFLWRVSTLYKKIILYYATMCLFNYNVVQKMEFTKTANAKKITKDYETVLKHLNLFNFKNEFATAIALAIRDGVYCGFMYDNENEGMFLHMLPIEYYRIIGKNERGQWVVAFDMTYFSQGQNIIFVEGIDGDMSGCWDEIWIQAWNEYNNDTQNKRWFIIPSTRTITLLAGLDDEFDVPLPLFTGIFIDLLEIIDYGQLLADRTELENYKLLMLGIPLSDDDNIVNDFKINVEYARQYQQELMTIVPSLVGVGILPGMSLETVSFNSNSTAETSDIVSNSIKNLYKTVGVSEVVVSSGETNSAVGIKNSIANDSAYTFLLIKRLESNFQYYMDNNISDQYLFSILRQTWYNEQDFVDNVRQAATLGSSALVFLESQGYTPYEAYCQILFENAIGIKDIMTPLLSSYNSGISKDDQDSTPGRDKVSDEEVSDSRERTRNIEDED